MEECKVGTGTLNESTYVALTEERYPTVVLYDLKSVSELGEGQMINPRVTLRGHEHPVRVICNK